MDLARDAAGDTEDFVSLARTDEVYTEDMNLDDLTSDELREVARLIRGLAGLIPFAKVGPLRDWKKHLFELAKKLEKHTESLETK